MKFEKLIRKSLDRLKANKQEDIAPVNSFEFRTVADKLILHFRSELEKKSFGQRMLYPMCFYIEMNPDDYKQLEIDQDPRFLFNEVVKEFYDIIEQKRTQYPDYTPPAKYWYFQFLQNLLNTEQTEKPDSEFIIRDRLKIRSKLVTHDIIGNVNNTSVSNDNHGTKTNDDPSNEVKDVMNDMNVNRDAIKNVRNPLPGVFICSFLFRDLAVLSYSKNGKNYDFTMRSNLLHLSGKNERRIRYSFFILESENIENSHVQIKYIEEEKKFQLAAFGPTRLNEREVEKSCGGNMKWCDLPNNSTIFINGEISVNFKIIK